MTDQRADEVARLIYTRRLTDLRKTEAKLAEAKAKLGVLFQTVFKHPEAAAERFLGLVERQGLAAACDKMGSKPGRPTEPWKTLNGTFHPFDGMDRVRERAVESLGELPTLYRDAERAERNVEVAQQLLAASKEELDAAQQALPEVQRQSLHQHQRQRRRLRQR